MVGRTTPTTMLVSWTPLTLSEARGFVTFYTVAYTPVLNSRRRQVSQDTMYMSVSADSSSVTIVGLDGSLAYSVPVSAGTRAGQGVQSTAQVAGITEGERSNTPMYSVFDDYYIIVISPNSGTSGTNVNAGAIIGGVVAVVFILAVTVITIALVLRRKQCKEFQPQ